MAKKRYKRQLIGSFFGEWIYDRVVPQNHLLRRLEEIGEVSPILWTTD